MPNLRDSIEHLMHLERPLPLSITENLRLNHQKLVKLHEQFKDIASEMYVWTFYETEDSLLSGYADADFDEVHFSAPLASIKSTLVECRHEQAFSLECKHGECASFGTKNEKLKSLFLKDLGQAVQKAQDLAAVEHVPLNLGEHVKLDLIGFYDDPDSDTESDVRMYVSKPRLNDFLHMGPEECLKERLKGMAPKPRRASSITQKDSRLISSGGLAIRLGAALQDGRSKVQSMWAAMSPDMGSASDVSLPSGTPEIVVNSPSVSDLRGTVSNPPQVPRNALNLSIPSLWTPRTSRSGSRTVSLDERRPSSAFDPPPFHNNSKNDVTVSRISNAHTVGKGDANPGATSQKRPAGIRRASGFEDFPAGFSRPKANERKFMWIHLPYTNPHWVKVIVKREDLGIPLRLTENPENIRKNG